MNNIKNKTKPIIKNIVKNGNIPASKKKLM